MLERAGFNPNSIFYTYTFLTRPAKNDINSFCGPRTSVPKDYPYPALSQGKYIAMEHIPELARLANEIATVRPDLILALGNTPAWALLRRTGIGKLRGSVFPNELDPNGPPVFPTYSPSAVLRQWELRTIVIADLMKAKRFLDEGFHPPVRELWLDPTMAECEEFVDRFILGPDANCSLLSVDIETLSGTTTCVGFSPRPDLSLTIPFFDPLAPGKNFWPTFELEKQAYLLVKSVMESPIPKLGQNFLYDTQYFVKWGIQPVNISHDTMIRHHALLPEMEKGLGFLGSIYTDEAPWKLLRDRNKDNLKADDE
jgi:hypothetical protein